jgi:hypothetical protein
MFSQKKKKKLLPMLSLSLYIKVVGNIWVSIFDIYHCRQCNFTSSALEFSKCSIRALI